MYGDIKIFYIIIKNHIHKSLFIENIMWVKQCTVIIDIFMPFLICKLAKDKARCKYWK